MKIVPSDNRPVAKLGASGIAGSKATPRVDQLTDVDLTGIADGDVLVWDDATDTWIVAPPGAVAELDDVGDVNAPTPADGQYLRWDATPGEWVASDLSALDLDDLADVDTTGVADGDVLTYDSGTSEWVPSAPSGGSGAVATDAIWDAAGDLAVGSGSNTAARLPAGSEDDVLTIVSGVPAWAAPSPGGGGGLTLPLDDYLASSGSARNDEFDDGPGIDGKWTLTGTTPDDVDENNDYPELLLLRRNDTSSQLSVYHQDLPSFPCDITARMPAASISANFARGAGLVLTPTTPTTSSAVFYLGWLYNSGKQVSAVNYTSFSGFGSTAYAFNLAPGPDGLWVRITVLTGTTYNAYWSVDGYFWNLAISGGSTSFTIARAGIGLAPEGQGADLFGLWSHYRVSA